MIGVTNTQSPRYLSKEWFKYGSNAQTDTWDTIPGHYYLLGVSTLSGASENSGPHIVNLEVIKQQTSCCRCGSSSGLSADGWLFVVKATDTTARMNCRILTESIDSYPNHNCVHWIDLGGKLPTTFEENIHQAAQTYTLSPTIRGHYYAVFVSALHDTSEYFTMFLRTQNCQDILHTGLMQTTSSTASLVADGILGIVRAGFTSSAYILRNAHSNAPQHQVTLWLDLGENFIK